MNYLIPSNLKGEDVILIMKKNKDSIFKKILSFLKKGHLKDVILQDVLKLSIFYL